MTDDQDNVHVKSLEQWEREEREKLQPATSNAGSTGLS